MPVQSNIISPSSGSNQQQLMHDDYLDTNIHHCL